VKQKETKMTKKEEKQRLLENAGLVKPKLNETFEVNPKYTHFAVLKNSGKIVEAWEYGEYDSQELKSEKDWYFFNDLRDNDISPKAVSIVTKKYLERNGINPFNWENWHKGDHDDTTYMTDKEQKKYRGY